MLRRITYLILIGCISLKCFPVKSGYAAEKVSLYDIRDYLKSLIDPPMGLRENWADVQVDLIDNKLYFSFKYSIEVVAGEYNFPNETVEDYALPMTYAALQDVLPGNRIKSTGYTFGGATVKVNFTTSSKTTTREILHSRTYKLISDIYDVLKNTGYTYKVLPEKWYGLFIPLNEEAKIEIKKLEKEKGVYNIQKFQKEMKPFVAEEEERQKRKEEEKKLDEQYKKIWEERRKKEVEGQK